MTEFERNSYQWVLLTHVMPRLGCKIVSGTDASETLAYNLRSYTARS